MERLSDARVFLAASNNVDPARVTFNMDDAPINRCPGGAYVRAWVWVSEQEIGDSYGEAK